MDCTPPCSSVHGILQVRILEWVASAFSRRIFQTQGWNPDLPHCRQVLYRLSHQGKPAKAVLIDKKGIRSQTLEEKSKREYEGPECFFFFFFKHSKLETTDLYVETQKIVVTK